MPKLLNNAAAAEKPMRNRPMDAGSDRTAHPNPNAATGFSSLRHPLVVALAGLVLGALAQALFIGGQMSQRVQGVEAGLDRIHARLDRLYSRDMADRDLAKVQLQFTVIEGRIERLELRDRQVENLSVGETRP